MNMLRALWLLLTFVILAGMGFDPIDYQIGPLLIGEHVDSALTFLGKPIRVETFTLEHRSGGRELIDSVWVDIPVDTNIVYTFDGLEVCTERDGSIRSIDLSTSRFATHRGIRVGDSSNAILKHYGKPWRNLNGTGEYGPQPTDEWTYRERYSTLGIVFYTVNDRVTRIFVGWGGT
jgi:hypothetical protein